MKLTLITILLGFGMSAASFGADAFRVYAPCSKTQTLWIVNAVPKVDGGLELNVAEKRNLGFHGRVIATHPKKPLLYVAGGGEERGKVPGAVVALARDGGYASHQRVDLNDDAAYLSLDRNGEFLFTVSYGNGRLNVYRLGEDGLPGKAVATVDEGKKQAHCVLISPDNQFLYIPYVKSNLALLQYRFDASTGAVTPLDPHNANPPQGTGPRHLVYHPTLPMVYFTNEQGIGLSTYQRSPNGQLVLRQDIAILPEGMLKDGLSASDLEITPDGKFIFAGLRGHSQDFDRIARYRVREDGQAELLGLTPADKIPWGLTLSPDGNYLLVSAYTGATLTAYRITTQGDLEKVASLPWDAQISDLLTLPTNQDPTLDLPRIRSRTDLDAVIAATPDAALKKPLAEHANAILAGASRSNRRRCRPLVARISPVVPAKGSAAAAAACIAASTSSSDAGQIPVRLPPATSHTSGQTRARPSVTSRPTVPSTVSITDTLRRVWPSLMPLIRERTQKPLSFIHIPGFEPQPIATAT